MQIAAQPKSRNYLRFAVVFAVAFGGFKVQAREMAGRWGFGIANLGGNIGPSVNADSDNVDVSSSGSGSLPPSLSIIWHPTEASAFEFDMGIDTAADNNLLALGTRYFRHVFLEENTIFSVLVGGGLLSQTVNGDSKSGYFLELGAGPKYFPPGAPNLGLGFIGTLGIRSAGTVRFTTQALLNAHYYF